jgi:hypothetical protein
MPTHLQSLVKAEVHLVQLHPALPAAVEVGRGPRFVADSRDDVRGQVRGVVRGNNARVGEDVLWATRKCLETRPKSSPDENSEKLSLTASKELLLGGLPC